MALLHVLWRLSRERHWEIHVAHVQHGMRGSSSLRDQSFVETVSGRLQLKCHVETVPVRAYAKAHRTGLEESARTLRYIALSRVARRIGSRYLACAHNANDQAETVLLHILRGTGLDGLCGIWPCRPLAEITGHLRDRRIQLVRPLLEFSRKDVLFYLHSQGLSFRRDASNFSLEFRRNWVRRKLIPMMEKVQPQAVRNLGQISLYMRAERDTRQVRIKTLSEALLRDGGRQLDLQGLFRYDIRSRFEFLHRLRPGLSRRQIEGLHAWLEKTKPSKRALPLSSVISKFKN